jgi:hypothetical protein
MRKLLSIAAMCLMCLGLALAVPVANAHGDDPGHSHDQITQRQARDFAKRVVAAMVREKAVGESWNKATLTTASKKKRGRTSEWVVVFDNPAEPDPAKRSLHVFLDLEGEYLAANHSGR